MSVLALSDVFTTVKDWFVKLPELISENIFILYAIIAAVVVIVVLAVVLIIVAVKKSAAKRKKLVKKSVAKRREKSLKKIGAKRRKKSLKKSVEKHRKKAEAQSAEVIAKEQPIEEVTEQPIEEVAEKYVEEVATVAVQEPTAKEDGAEALWKQVLAEVYASAPIVKLPAEEFVPLTEQSVDELTAKEAETAQNKSAEGAATTKKKSAVAKKKSAKETETTKEQTDKETATAKRQTAKETETTKEQTDKETATAKRQTVKEAETAKEHTVQETAPVAQEPIKSAPAAAQPAQDQTPLPAGATVRTVEEEGWYVRTLYNRSFKAKLIQSDQTVKDYYSKLKNELLAYDTTARISWKHESFRKGRNTQAKFIIRGKTLCLCLALDAKDYAESKYIVDDISKLTSYASTPLLYRIKNARRCRYAAELIAALFGAENRIQREEEDFSSIPWQDTNSLVEEGLAKIVRTERVRLAEGQVPVEEMYETDEDDEDFDDDIEELDEVEASAVSTLMGDEYAKSLLTESSEYSDKTRQCIVNIEVLGRFFEDGETVTLEELKKRVPIIDKRATYVKVLARGILSKALVVVADDFSIEAIKMIALTGGRAVRKKRK